MAVKKTENEVVETKTENEVVETKTEFKSDDKYWVRNLCSWTIGCSRAASIGDISIPANGKMLLTDEEIRGQIFKGNVLFIGDGDGSHARVFIENKDFRIDVGFETEDTLQMIVNDETLKEIFAITPFEAFKSEVTKKITTDSEKYSLITYAKKNKLNNYEKIKFMEEYTEYRF